MKRASLQTYLADHFAGATAGVTLLADLAHLQAGSGFGDLFAALHAEVVEDRAVLERLIERMDLRESRVRVAAAWTAEKFARLKARVDDPGHNAFELLELVEAMSLGVEGKRLLWVALATVADSDATIAGPDYPQLIQRAESQRARLESCRQAMALNAFTG